jgi:hypothetical protein
VGGVKLGRGVAVRVAVAERERERGLVIGTVLDRDAGGLAAQRVAAVGADDEAPPHGDTADERQRGASFIRDDGLRLAVHIGQARGRRHRLPQRVGEMRVLDVPAEGVAADFGGVEPHLRRAPQPAGIVDDAQAAQRRGMGAAALPDAECVERRDRGADERCGAVIGDGGAPRRQRGRHAGMGQRQRRREAGRAAADNDCVR